jgi:DNA polymerase beta
MAASIDYKQAMIDQLAILLRDKKAEGDVFRAKAYATAINTLKGFAGPVKSMGDVKGLKGIGAKIAAKLSELIDTGKIGEVQRVVEEKGSKNALLDSLMEVYGIGPAHAKRLVDKGIASIDDLVKRQDELLNDKQRMGLRYYKDFQLRIPRKEMLHHARIIRRGIRMASNVLGVPLVHEITGSFRRGAAESGDIDVMVSIDADQIQMSDMKIKGEKIIKTVVDILMEGDYLQPEELARGPKKFMGVSRVKQEPFRRFDLIFTTPEEYPFALVYFTGSGEFNVEMRNWCLQNGFTLNEHSATPLTKEARKKQKAFGPIRTERDLFDLFELEYVEPEQRRQGAVRPKRTITNTCEC